MGDVDGVVLAGADVREFVRQHPGGQVQAAVGQGLLAVAERGFDDEHGHVEGVDAVPEGGVAFGVA